MLSPAAKFFLKFARACWLGWAVLPERSRRTNTESKLAAAGFEQIDIEPTRIYRSEDALEFLSGQQIPVKLDPAQIDGKFFSGFIRAVKPISGQQSCCGPTCCN